MRLAIISAAIVALGSASVSSAALVLSQSDGASPKIYANGGGSGFGGTLGAGSISMDASGGNLNVSFTAGGSLNDNVVIYLDTKSGGFTDSQMNDTADGGRSATSNLTRDVDDVLPILPDYGLVVGNFGSVLFELNAGTTAGHLNFLIFNAAPNISIPLATLGGPTNVDFVAGYASGSMYNSNESLPATTAGINQLGGNPGFGDGSNGGVNPAPSQVVYDNYNRFVIPEPASLAALAGVALVGLRRRK